MGWGAVGLGGKGPPAVGSKGPHKPSAGARKRGAVCLSNFLVYKTRNSGHYAPFFLAPTEGFGSPLCSQSLTTFFSRLMAPRMILCASEFAGQSRGAVEQWRRTPGIVWFVR